MPLSLENLAAPYELFLSQFERTAIAEPDALLNRSSLPSEIGLQMLWVDRALGCDFVDDRQRRVSIVHRGVWNRGAGPDFLNATIEIDGNKICGDIEIDIQPEDWERHGHGANSNFNNVLLHVVCLPPSQTWFTRNERHESVACVVIPDERLRPFLGDASRSRIERAPAVAACRETFANMSDAEVGEFLKSVAAYRLGNKKRSYANRCSLSGNDQVLYECLAETLGYSANRDNMRHLAKRAPLEMILENPEAILFGTAGFLVPLLKESCDEETRAYHKNLWTFWWKNRETFELASQRGFSWVGGVRPSNHPQRRLAALALIVAQWRQFAALCNPSSVAALADLMTSLRHDYWSRHVALPSARLKKPLALIGKDRATDFIVNHIMPMIEGEKEWNAYLSMNGGTPSSKAVQAARRLLVDEKRVAKFTRKAFHQQALLQIDADFCLGSCRGQCRLPEQAGEWVG